MAKKLGRLYDGQICLVAGERADHGNAFSSSPPLLHLLFLDFFFFSQTKKWLFYSIVFIMTFSSILDLLQKKKHDLFLPSECADGILSCCVRVV
jgi:hypothetical protein